VANAGGSAVFFVSNNQTGSITIEDSITRNNLRGTVESHLGAADSEASSWSHARYWHQFDDLDKAVLHHEMRMSFQILGERFL
jgi:hypothetical protein